MKVSIQSLLSLTILFLSSSISAELEHDSLNHKLSNQRRHSHLSHQDQSSEKRDAFIKREIALAPLPESIKRDLQSMDPQDYTLFPRGAGDGIRFDAGGKAHDNDDTWVNGHGPGRGNCARGFAYTFDDGPYTWHKELSDLFDSYGAKANFAVNGYNWGCIYDEANVKNLKAAHKAGHLYLSHTWSHANLTDGLTAKQLDQQVVLVEQALWKILGVVPAYLRPPYGETNRTILDYYKKKHGITVVQWSDDAGDAAGESYQSSIKMYKGFKAGEKHLTLNHEVKTDSVHHVAPSALKHLKKIGSLPITLDKCLKNSPAPYKLIGKPQKRDSTWTCEGTPAPGSG